MFVKLYQHGTVAASTINKRRGMVFFAIIHLYFLVMMFWHNGFSLGLLCLALLTAISYAAGLRNYPHNVTVDGTMVVPSILSALAGGMVCYVIGSVIGPVPACGLTGLMASFLPHLITDKKYHELPYSAYCGCFTGMTATSVIPQWWGVALAAAAAGLVFAITKRSLEGMGGKLGSIAFAMVIIFSILQLHLLPSN